MQYFFKKKCGKHYKGTNFQQTVGHYGPLKKEKEKKKGQQDPICLMQTID